MKRTAKDADESNRSLSRRALMLGGAQLAFVAVLGLRMRHLQLEQAEQFRMLADENRINLRLLPPARGQIFERNGHPIAMNEQNYRVVIVREDAGDVSQVLDRLADLIPLPADVREQTAKDTKALVVMTGDGLK